MNIKIYVRNEEESKLAQEKAFELGILWHSIATPGYMQEKHPFLYFRENITYGDSFKLFKRDTATELTLKEWLDYEVEEEGPSHELEKAMIELGYFENDLKKRVAKIERALLMFYQEFKNRKSADVPPENDVQ